MSPQRCTRPLSSERGTAKCCEVAKCIARAWKPFHVTPRNGRGKKVLHQTVKELFIQATVLKCMRCKKQTTNLNGDDSCAPRCFDSNKEISHVTRQNLNQLMLHD